jgi:hypothetical protein
VSRVLVIEFTDTPLNGVEAKLVGTDLAVYQMTVPDALEALASMLADVGLPVWEEHLHDMERDGEPSNEGAEATEEVVATPEDDAGLPQLASPGEEEDEEPEKRSHHKSIEDGGVG